MFRTWAVVKREFNESVRTKTFVIGTIFGPLFMLAIFTVPALLMGEGGEVRDVVIVDASGAGLGDRVAAALPAAAAAADAALPEEEKQTRYRIEVVSAAGAIDADRLRTDLRRRVTDEELDGYLWIPTGILDDGEVLYEGRNATNFAEIGTLRSTVQQAVQQMRLSDAGIDAARVASALRPVAFDARKSGEGEETTSAESAAFVAYILGFLMYMVVIMYGTAVLRGVLEEKRDRIVEIIVSSMEARQLMLGKIVGIAAAGLLQIGVWVGFAALVLGFGEDLLIRFGANPPELPAVPLAVGLILLVCFAFGGFLYLCIFAALGAMATTDQEAQQLIFPAFIPIIIAMMMMAPVITNPDGTAAVFGSLFPLTSPILMPMRSALTRVPMVEIGASILLLAAGSAVFLWAGAKIYRIGILTTGKKPSAREVWRWLRTA